MKQIHFAKVEDRKTIHSLEMKWQESLSAPIDDYFDHMIDSSVHWSIKEEEEIIGYASIDKGNRLRQFFLLPHKLNDGIAIFQQMIATFKIKEARIATNNMICLSIAMHFQKSIEIASYSFSSFTEENPLEKKKGFRIAELSDLDVLVKFVGKEVGGSEDWTKEYIGGWIKRKEYFILENGAEILGTCEVRTKDKKPNVACLGMIVSSNHRKKGLGTFLLGKAKEIALERNQEPICGCDKDNIGSSKAIRANGFAAIHQILKITFPT